uniref:GH16 domain-containing protein n=1 Tax=Macrostomum lignano TaxID=282301 RepID=A0A1I8I9M8_9PLAT
MRNESVDDTKLANDEAANTLPCVPLAFSWTAACPTTCWLEANSYFAPVDVAATLCAVGQRNSAPTSAFWLEFQLQPLPPGCLLRQLPRRISATCCRQLKPVSPAVSFFAAVVAFAGADVRQHFSGWTGRGRWPPENAAAATSGALAQLSRWRPRSSRQSLQPRDGSGCNLGVPNSNRGAPLSHPMDGPPFHIAELLNRTEPKQSRDIALTLNRSISLKFFSCMNISSTSSGFSVLNSSRTRSTVPSRLITVRILMRNFGLLARIDRHITSYNNNRKQAAHPQHAQFFILLERSGEGPSGLTPDPVAAKVQQPECPVLQQRGGHLQRAFAAETVELQPLTDALGQSCGSIAAQLIVRQVQLTQPSWPVRSSKSLPDASNTEMVLLRRRALFSCAMPSRPSALPLMFCVATVDKIEALRPQPIVAHVEIRHVRRQLQRVPSSCSFISSSSSSSGTASTMDSRALDVSTGASVACGASASVTAGAEAAAPNAAVNYDGRDLQFSFPKCTSYPCLVFEDNFDSLDFDKWEHEITAGGGGNWEFQYYHNNRRNSFTRDGKLFIKPTLTAEDRGEEFVRNGHLDLWGSSPANLCTGNQWWGCSRSAGGGNIVNPIQSARLRTANTFAFRYGRIEVEAKMPTGDWIWPAIWLLPRRNEYGEWPCSGEIDLVESRGNRNLQGPDGKSAGVDQMGMTLHWGPKWPLNAYSKTHATKNLSGGKTFGTDFHKYQLEWGPEIGLVFSLDGEHVMTVNPPKGFWEYGKEFWVDEKTQQPLDKATWNPWKMSGGATRLAPFDKPFYIIMNVAVGGVNYFGDELTNSPYPKPWRNTDGNAMGNFYSAKNLWLPTWKDEKDETAMQINQYQLFRAIFLGLTLCHQRCNCARYSRQELQFAFTSSGASLIGLHYSINKLLSGVEVGDVNVDLLDAVNNQLVHRQRVNLKDGDYVSYWYVAIVNGQGFQRTGQRWEYRTAPPTTTTTSPPPTTTSKGHQPTQGPQPIQGNACYCMAAQYRLPMSLPQRCAQAIPVFVRNGHLELWGSSPANLCTGNQWVGCSRTAGGGNIVNPIQSVRLRTVNNFAFSYGRIEVRVKWRLEMLSFDSHKSTPDCLGLGEINLVEARGNRNLRGPDGQSVGIDQMDMTLHWGPKWPYNGYSKTHATKNLSGGNTFGSSFSLDGKHVMTVNPPKGFWEYGKKFWVDEKTQQPLDKATWNPWKASGGATRLAPFDKPFYIIMNVAVGGVNYFGDELTNSPYPKPWRNTDGNAMGNFYSAKHLWLPTWTDENDETAMQVNYVRVWKLQP